MFILFLLFVFQLYITMQAVWRSAPTAKEATGNPSGVPHRRQQ
jgi:hypothetical protein